VGYVFPTATIKQDNKSKNYWLKIEKVKKQEDRSPECMVLLCERQDKERRGKCWHFSTIDMLGD